jgi:CBS domain-containing protein
LEEAMQTLNQLLEIKGRNIWSVEPESSVFTAIKAMAEHGVGALLVIESGRPVGIISERDYARKVILQGRSSQQTPVREIMTTRVIYAKPDVRIGEAMALMTERRIRHLPVIDGGSLQGIVSIGDLVKTIIAEQQHRIEQLENYISG